MTDDKTEEIARKGLRVKVLGRLAAMSLAELREELQARGAILVGEPSAEVDWLVLGEQTLLSPDDPALAAALHASEHNPAETSHGPQIIWESELWQRLGLVDNPVGVQKLYTPGLIARLLNLPVTTVRRWYRWGLLIPAQVVCRLPYFDYQEVIRARNLARLAESGLTAGRLLANRKRLVAKYPFLREALRRWPLVFRGEEAYFRCGDGLVDLHGQMHFDFTEGEPTNSTVENYVIPFEEAVARRDLPARRSPEEWLILAEQYEENDRLPEAIEVYRLLLAMHGPHAEICFRLADALYRSGDLSGAKERYFMSIELDRNFAEAYVNLGSVLQELGEKPFAAAAFQGALAIHPEYADAHFLLAQLLEDVGRGEEAKTHWARFLELVPDGPWCEIARAHLEAGDR